MAPNSLVSPDTSPSEMPIKHDVVTTTSATPHNGPTDLEQEVAKLNKKTSTDGTPSASSNCSPDAPSSPVPIPTSPDENEDAVADVDDVDGDGDISNEDGPKPTKPPSTSASLSAAAAAAAAVVAANARIVQSSRVLHMWTPEQDVCLNELVAAHHNPLRAPNWSLITSKFNELTGMHRTSGSVRIHYERINRDKSHRSSQPERAKSGSRSNKISGSNSPAPGNNRNNLSAGERAGIKHLATTARAWSEQEIEIYYLGLKRFGRDHDKIHELLKPEKTLDQVINYHSNVNRSYGDFLSFVKFYDGKSSGAELDLKKKKRISMDDDDDEDDKFPPKPQGKRRRYQVQRLMNEGVDTAPKPHVPSGTVIHRDESLIGQQLSVWWPNERKSYLGTVIGFNSTKSMHHIQYEDGKNAWHDLRDLPFKIKNGPNATAEQTVDDYTPHFKKSSLKDCTDRPILVRMDYLQALFFQHRDAAKGFVLGR